MGARYAAVPDGATAFSPLIMRTTTVGPGGKYGGGKEARHTPQRLEGLARVVAKFQATNGEELKFELQRASGLEPTQVPVLEVIPPRKLLELGRTQFVLSAASRRCRRSRRRTHLGQLATCFAGSTTAALRQKEQRHMRLELRVGSLPP